jgi:hypothetical protein
MIQYRNDGAPFTAADGRRIQRGQIFVPAPSDLARRRYKLRAVGHVAHAPEVSTPIAAAPVVAFEGVDFASDRAYELARDHHIDPRALPPGGGSGAGGAYRVADILTIVQPAPPSIDTLAEAPQDLSDEAPPNAD